MVRSALAILSAVALDAATAQGTSKDFPPGYNSEAPTPPMGWRSWNAFGPNIDEQTFTTAIDYLVAKAWDVPGRSGKVTLAELGYLTVGIDEGWENCSGADPNHGLRQHDEDGFPMVNIDRFPDFKRLVDYGHSKNISMGWYLNGCACGERQEREVNYKGDVQRLLEYGFDAVKFDGCGAATNMTKYAEYMSHTGRSYATENCHWGHCGADSWYHNPDGSSCPTQTWAPFNWFRTSGDINGGALSWLNNLQTAIRFLDYEAPLSQPGVWAYPDMLEVGRVAEPAVGTFYSWNRAHFGAWCVVSAPLVLGMALTDDKIAPIVDIIANEEAIAVNQRWAGHPGMLVETIYSPPLPYSPNGTVIPSSSPGDFGIESPVKIRPAPSHSDESTSGAANIRTGGPGQVGVIRVGQGFVGNGHRLASVSMSFRYLAGYAPPAGQAKKAPIVKVQLRDMETGDVLKTIATTEPLGNYSFDHFTTYSPPIAINATGLDLLNNKPIILVLEITNNERNLQIPIDDLAKGFDAKVQWMPEVDSVSASPKGSGQLWAKPQPNGSMAAFAVNYGSGTLNHTIDFKALNLTGASYHVRDIWAHTDNGTAVNQLNVTIPSYDSMFILLTPEMHLSV